MGMNIEHFMWGYQMHFRTGAEVHAGSVFRLLDPRFDPEVFLVGILAEDRKDRHPACVEPENYFWIQSEAFNNVPDKAKTLVATYPESQMFHSHPLAQKWETEKLWKRAVQETINRMIDEAPDKPADMTYFASFPALVDGFLVSVVLGLQTAVIDSHYRLGIDRANIHEYRSFKAAVSLIDATVDAFLSDAAQALHAPDAAGFSLMRRSTAETIRSAGNELMTGLAYKADSNLDLIGCWQALFDACNAVAALKYEGTPAAGRAIVARKEHPAVNHVVTFSAPLPVHNSRAARKLLELASHGLHLHINAGLVFGLGQIGNYDPAKEDAYEIVFSDNYCWELVHAGHALMHVRAGQPHLPAPLVNKDRLRTEIKRGFRGIDPEDTDRLVQLVETAANAEHGTILVIAPDAQAEAKRLASHATGIQPIPLTPNLLAHLMSIDGAVLLDESGICYALGVILDGLDTGKGNPARGARFNSAIRYVETRKRDGKQTLAIVVSEDGGVDVVPDLPPPIRRSPIDEAIAELESIAESDQINRRRFRKLREWCEAHVFYLTEKDCEKLNGLVKHIEDRFEQENPDGARVIFPPFAPNPEFDPDLYYEQE